MKRKAVIVGGGIAGLGTAFELTKLGWQVTVLEAGQLGREATWAAAGMLCPIHELDFQELELLHAGRQSRDKYRQWAEVLEPFGLEYRGALEVALSADDVPYLERLFRFQQQHGLTVEWLTGKGLRERFPYLSLDVPAGIFAPEDGQLDNRLLVEVLRNYLLQNGATIYEHTKAASMQPEGPIALAQTHDNQKFAAEIGIWAIGAAATGKPELAGRPIQPIKGQMLAFEPDPNSLSLTVPIRIRSRRWGNAYIVPKAGRILVGSTSEEQGREAGLTAGGMLDILRKCYHAVPGIYDLRLLDSWVGYRPATFDRKPVLCKHQCGNLFSINGLYRHGILLTPLLAEQLACWVDHGKLPGTFALDLSKTEA